MEQKTASIAVDNCCFWDRRCTCASVFCGSIPTYPCAMLMVSRNRACSDGGCVNTFYNGCPLRSHPLDAVKCAAFPPLGAVKPIGSPFRWSSAPECFRSVPRCFFHRAYYLLFTAFSDADDGSGKHPPSDRLQLGRGVSGRPSGAQGMLSFGRFQPMRRIRRFS